ncbi:UDP-2,3-diacylglucosamine diphosphatase [Pistricoccus aurantiacus]|uniref:UDP-2,3-diacylglucosamine hydrolase n=1 Tax=Pistricoccus aurantiacus TaxID=1883414 RepID=A0A5B8SYE5_9GAMM|nr:UDP-2,3-diacylglucosamine diphosphatase [Pistricoccus aurantiacus]QEA39858.1 UDP-2,3-diacylglucosamine diphosphatase [Pistricoccus aurantiacus]
MIRLISDLHLHPGQPAIAAGFLNYLERQASQAEALYILGDFFEAWIGDDILDIDVDHPQALALAALARQVAERLRKLTKNSTRLYLMHGNRDFLLGERFAEACGGTLLEDPSLIHCDGQPLLLMHGDSLCTRDEAYMQFRAQARNPAWQQQILAMPLEERLQLAQQLRNQSGESNSNKPEDIMDVTEDEVRRTMVEHGVDILIHGHTHRPAVHELQLDGKPAKRFVLGDWRPDQGWEILIADGKAPRLQSFSLTV